MVSGSRRVGRQRARNKIQTETKAANAVRALGYLRVSTEEQAATGHGLEAQEKAVRSFAESQGYELIEVLTDPGVSGATRPADRPAFAQALELAAASAFDVLLVAKIDRLRDRQPEIPRRDRVPVPLERDRDARPAAGRPRRDHRLTKASMRIELVHEPSAGPRPFLLRDRLTGGLVQEGFATRKAAEAARPAFASALRKAFA